MPMTASLHYANAHTERRNARRLFFQIPYFAPRDPFVRRRNRLN
jgi:hypothetical protein